MLYDQIGGVVTRGRFAFDGRYTQNPLLPAAQRGGAAMADFLLGHVQPRRRPGRRSDRQLPLELLRALLPGHLEGDATQLTVNYGLRWEIRPAVLRQVRRDRQHRLPLGQLDRAGLRARRRRAIRTRATRRSGSPRTSSTCATDASAAARTRATSTTSRRGSAIAWAITPKTVLRSGGGIYYVRDIGNAVFDTVRNAPFTIRRDEPAESFRPNLSFQQPFARTGAPTFILVNQYDEPSSYVAQWSFGFQREVTGNMSVEATYFGSAGVHLRRLMSYNNPEPSQLPNSNNARPFPKFGSIQVMSAPSHSSYHALYLKLQRRFSRRPELPQLVLVGQVHRQRQRHPHVGRRLADAVEQLRPRARARTLGVRLPPPLDDVVAVGAAVRQGPAMDEHQHRHRSPARRLADRRHPDAAGRLPLHGAPAGRATSRMAAGSATPMPRASTGACRATSGPARAGSTPTRSSIARPPSGPFRYGTVARNSLIGPGIVSVDASPNKDFN